MNELTFEEFCQQPMQLVMHISGEKEHYLHKHSKPVGVRIITRTPVKKNGDFGKPKQIFVFDEKDYDTVDQVYVVYMEKVCGVRNE